MEILDERERKKKKLQKTKTKKTKNKDKKKQISNANYSESVRVKWFYYTFNLGFVQLICKAFLIFKSSLELALSIILKETRLYESKRIVVECRCLKICYLLSFLICSSILVLK